MTFQRIRSHLFYVLAGLLGAMIALPASAQGTENPFKTPNDTWITIRGRVESVSRDGIMLDFGKGGKKTIAVDIIGNNPEGGEAYKLAPDDKVTVFGLVDNDPFAGTTIKASSIYVDRMDTTLYATVDDPDELYRFGGESSPNDPGNTILRGVVTAVGNNHFTLNSGPRALEIETGKMPYDPLDSHGRQQVKVGDVVRVSGQVDRNFFERSKFAARTIDIVGHSEIKADRKPKS